MITEEVDEELYQKAKALFYNSSEAKILQPCHDRAERYQDIRYYQRVIAEKTQACIEMNMLNL